MTWCTLQINEPLPTSTFQTSMCYRTHQLFPTPTRKSWCLEHSSAFKCSTDQLHYTSAYTERRKTKKTNPKMSQINQNSFESSSRTASKREERLRKDFFLYFYAQKRFLFSLSSLCWSSPWGRILIWDFVRYTHSLFIDVESHWSTARWSDWSVDIGWPGHP